LADAKVFCADTAAYAGLCAVIGGSRSMFGRMPAKVQAFRPLRASKYKMPAKVQLLRPQMAESS
jgi:hypothetical protein